MVECPVCAGDVTLGGDLIDGELLVCGECGTELELTQVDPPVLAEAPQEEEDWGQ